MKTILLALCLAAALPARADVIAVSANKAGGLLLLTNNPCPSQPNGKVLMSTQADGANVLYGCASGLTDELMLVIWTDGASSVFPLSSFQPYRHARKF